MNRAMHAVAAVLAATCLLVDSAGATVTNASVNPGAASIPADTSSTVVLNWQATTVPDASGAGGGGALVTSAEGVFRADNANGTVIGTNSTLIDAVAQGPAGQPGTATFAETVMIPLPVLAQANRLNATRIVYQRAFSDGPLQPMGGNVAEITLNLSFSLTVDATPATVNVSSGLASTLSVTWQVAGAGTGTQVSSPEGVFRAAGPAGQVLGRNARPLAGPVQAIGGMAVARLVETVQVPTRVTMRAEQVGAARIVYQRTFTAAGAQPGTGNAMLNLAGPQGGPFGINGVALRFADGSRQAVVGEGESPFAFADVTHVGTGRLEAQWEVAEPATTRGSPVFRTLNLVRRQLTGSGARTTLRSPSLPADVDGVYLVRLRVTSPEPAFEAPVLRYLVNPALPEAQPISVTVPASGAVHTATTRFAWAALDGAATYRVEFHELSADAPAGDAVALPGDRSDDAGTPLSGIAVDASVTDTGLSRLALSHLAPGRFYRWRVVAYDANGRLIGRSEPRRLYIPAADDGS